MSGLVGCTRTRAICCVSARPRNVQVLPPSVVFHTPSPWDTLPRIGNSPVPTYTMSGFDSETPIAPMVPPKYLSVTGSHETDKYLDRKSTRLNSSHTVISYAVF